MASPNSIPSPDDSLTQGGTTTNVDTPVTPNPSETLPQGSSYDISSQLTLIITTSPTPSAPSTSLLSQILSSFRAFCPPLLHCPVILILDTYDHISTTARLKKGHVTAEGAKKYALYKENAKALILREWSLEGKEGDLLEEEGQAEYGSVAYAQHGNPVVKLRISRTRDGKVTFVEPEQRLGFGLAVREGLRLARTEYVWVQQHDWSLVAQIPVGEVLEVMRRQSDAADEHELTGVENTEPTTKVPVKYVCFPSVRMLRYARSDHVMLFPALRALTNLHKQTFTVRDSTKNVQHKIPLTPLFFWHDKPHIAEKLHYLARVFPNRSAVPRGAFIEDTVGHRARDEMKEGQWRKWACWLYYPDEGKQLCLRHLKGRTWRGAEGELERKMELIRINQENGIPKRDGKSQVEWEYIWSEEETLCGD
ncbi:feruloyl esterase-like protein [Thermochaetoides thermophila DSM 1495]|uniref:Feruloyl esterase-like protein n=1 Tax=Chaetomium thermophilum (strain DSM 1495 / CBS 144.50 / IMI 039719) TaxID=759272 RepID=G0S976_CHATD|nr:feruloyl esterase-like protein [Thermochaetoides thermophila DSM 1495]EGS19987.1 feruloyl esterase-like protein [Thermochaetoides thermophila DSM 1495]